MQIMADAIFPIGLLLAFVTWKRPLLSGSLWVVSSLVELAFTLVAS
jgi:hypothetical protein